MHDHIIQGNWEVVSRLHASELAGHNVEIRILADKINPKKKGTMIYAGMFPELAAVTEADFKAAEWQGPQDGDNFLASPI